MSGRRDKGTGRGGHRETFIGRETDVPLGQPLDNKRGGAATKVAVLLGAFDRGNQRELEELAERFLGDINARTDPVADGSWGDKLRRLCTAIGQDDGREIRDLSEDFRRAPQVRTAMNNRSWQGWRERGYRE